MQSATAQLKRVLWERFASEAYPAEWDGRIYGGGKISQRFWEYFKAIELLDLNSEARLLDIGGGSPQTGISFFASLLASCGIPVFVLDVNFNRDVPVPENVTLISGVADRSSLSDVLKRYQPTHISCISVLEHASFEQQKGIFEAIQDSFEGSHLVCTLEFHEKKTFFEQQVTMASLSKMVKDLTRYYLADIEASPMHCENAFRRQNRLWYPLALRFMRV